MENSNLSVLAGRRIVRKEVAVQRAADCFLLRQAEEGALIAEVCGRRASAASSRRASARNTFCASCNRSLSQQLEEENAKLKKIVGPTCRRKIRCLTVVDTFTRLSPAIDVRHSYRGADVVATLERATRDIGLPKTIRLDNRPEFVCKELDLWAFMRGVTLDFSRPSRPTNN